LHLSLVFPTPFPNLSWETPIGAFCRPCTRPSLSGFESIFKGHLFPFLLSRVGICKTSSPLFLDANFPVKCLEINPLFPPHRLFRMISNDPVTILSNKRHQSSNRRGNVFSRVPPVYIFIHYTPLSYRHNYSQNRSRRLTPSDASCLFTRFQLPRSFPSPFCHPTSEFFLVRI